MRAKLGIAALTAVLVVATVTWIAPAGVQTNGVPPSLTLDGQDPWTPAGGTFTMRLRTNAVPEGVQLTLTVHDRLLSRSAFDATLTGNNPPLGQTLTLLRLPLDDYPADASGVRVVPVELSQLNVRRSGNGVYPIEVQLRDGDDHTLAGFITHVIVADLSATKPLPLEVAWVWPLVADPAFGFDGNANPAVVGQLGLAGRLGRQATLIGTDTDVPLTLAPSPETLDAWSTLAEDDVGIAAGVATLASALSHHQVLAGPFVPLDLPSVFDGGLGGMLRRGTRPRQRRAPDLLQLPRRPQHRDARPARRLLARCTPERVQDPARGRRERARAVHRTVHALPPGAHRTRARQRHGPSDGRRDRSRSRALSAG